LEDFKGYLVPKVEKLGMLVPMFQSFFDEIFDLNERAITNKTELSEAQEKFREGLIQTYNESHSDGKFSAA
jgi:hypothetical protein